VTRVAHGRLLSAALAPSAPLADALALAAADHGAPKDRFEYGWVRGAGSAAFIIGVIGSGQAVQAFGFNAALMGQAVLLIATSLWLAIVPDRIKDRQTARSAAMPDKGSVCELFRMPAFRWLIVVAALVLGSHALHDNFAIIRWTSAGLSTGTAGLLWSEQVVAEVAVFVFFGPALLSRLGPASAVAVSATAGVVRWTVMGLSTQPVVLALVEPLHGLTFSLLHLAAMRVIEASVPAQMAATAQTIYGTVGVGASVALLTLLSGLLYQHLSGMAFWVMAGLRGACQTQNSST
jgi:MFS transporter, PPP family, 3-phenylpropionic acid transporter